jgi:hypothetical protein
VGLIDNVIAVNRRHKRVLQDQREAATQWNLDGRIAPDSLMELSSVDMTVAFFEDRLEFRRRLGSKHGVIRYAELEAVRRARGMMNVASNSALANSLARKEVILTIASRRPLSFDFRSESAENVQRAIDMMRRGMSRRQP